MKSELIFDFETLSVSRHNCVVVNLATLDFNPSRFKSDQPYQFSELVEACTLIKFDIAEQKEDFFRIVDTDTLAWWQTLPREVQRQLLPSSDDVSIRDLPKYVKDNDYGNVWSRGNTFDPIILDYLCNDINSAHLFPFWKVKDTRSFLDGLLYGANIRNTFMPENLDIEFIHHDPCHDIALDVMRMQTVIKHL